MSGSDFQSLGAYRIIRELEAVAGGRLFRALDDATGTSVQIKLLSSEPDEDSLLQARRLGRVGNPGIPLLYEIGDHQGQTFLVSAEPVGQSLGQFVQEGGHLDRRTLVDWLRQTLIILAEAHAEGVIHGSLAVDALRIGADGRLQLTGFGLTQAHSDTPELQSPEKKAGQPRWAASDLYSLGALFHRLAAPRELGGASDRSLGAGDPLSLVLERAMAEDPRRRYQDASDMERALRGLEEALGGQPESVHAPQPAEAPEPATDPPAASVPTAPEAAFQTMAMDSSSLQELLRQPLPSGAQVQKESAPEVREEKSAAFGDDYPTPVEPISFNLKGQDSDLLRPKDRGSAPLEGDSSAPPSPQEPKKASGGRWALWLLFLLLLGAGAFFLATRGLGGIGPLTPAATAPSPDPPAPVGTFQVAPVPPAPPTLDEIRQLNDDGEETEAIAKLNELLESPSLADPVPALEILGTLQLQRGETTEARRVLESAAAVQPSGDLLYKLGLALIAEGDPEEAALRLREALALEPESFEIQEALLHLESEL